MVKKSKVSALVLAMLLGSVSGMAIAEENHVETMVERDHRINPAYLVTEFSKNMDGRALSNVIRAKLAKGVTLQAIVREAKFAGVDVGDLKAALIGAGQDPVIVSVLINSESTGASGSNGQPVGTNSNNGNSNGAAGGGGASPI